MSANQNAPDVRVHRTPEASRRCGFAPSTFSKLRVIGGGPRYVKIGRAVVYREADLVEWLEAHPTRRSTSDSAGEE